MSNRKDHVPMLGHSAPLHGRALCGRVSRWATGDHRLIARLALRYPDQYCRRCVERLNEMVERGAEL